jgi:hypothetical protein
VLCWQPFGRPVVPLVYIRNSGASAGIDTGSTTRPRKSAINSSMKKSRPSTMALFDAYSPGWRRHTSTLSTAAPCSAATAIASSALALWSISSPLR